jgi:transcriptional regulator with XRE-family HTH domain
MSNAEAFGQTVREAREKLALSQEELAHRADLHANAIGLIELGKRTPSLDTIVALAKGLATTPSRLVARFERKLADR